MKSYQILMPSMVLYGPGSFDNLGDKVTHLGDKALIVSDQAVMDEGYVGRLQKILEGQGISYEVFNEVVGEPTDGTIENGLSLYREGDCDFLIAIGGGSSIDAAKAIGLLATNPGNIGDYMGMGKVRIPLSSEERRVGKEYRDWW